MHRILIALTSALAIALLAGCGSDRSSYADLEAAVRTLEQAAHDAADEASAELLISDFRCDADVTTVNSLIGGEGNVFFCYVTFTDDNTALPGELRTKYFVDVQPDGCMTGEGNVLWFDFSPGRAANLGLDGDPPRGFSACARLDIPEGVS